MGEIVDFWGREGFLGKPTEAISIPSKGPVLAFLKTEEAQYLPD
jgi:hypothetical protein